MTESSRPSDQPPGPEAASSGVVNPKTTAGLLADYTALQNDLEQANSLASDFQRQLAGKSNECAQFKQVFEKTCRDLAHLQTGITALREERHRLANEAMMVTALKMKLTKANEERDRLLAELEAARRAADVGMRAVVARDQQIAELTLKLETLKEVLVVAQQRPAAREPRPAAVERPRGAENSRASADEDFIDIAFGR